MNSIKNNVSSSLEIKKSTFLNYLYCVTTIAEANHYLTLLKEDYKDASHHCFGYIIGDNQEIQKYSDDGEPSSTAGLPIINVLKKNNLTNVLSVTVRYFGGVKLGASGLIRAYSKSTANSLTKAKLTQLMTFSLFTCVIPFHYSGKLENYLRDNTTVLETTYDTKVHYKCEISHEKFTQTKQAIMNGTNGDAQIKLIKTINKYV